MYIYIYMCIYIYIHWESLTVARLVIKVFTFRVCHQGSGELDLDEYLEFVSCPAVVVVDGHGFKAIGLDDFIFGSK